jgi:cell wall-associated NlpC family hydrolase
MKLLLGLFAFLALITIGLPFLVVAVVATHPWIAVGMLSGSVQVKDNRPSAVKAGVPFDQWPLIVDASKQSTCNVNPEDLAAIARISNPTDTFRTIAGSLCASGYGVDRPRALNSYAGNSDFATAVTRLAAKLRIPSSVVQVAQQWIGVPYVFGGCSRRGVDCSCLVQLIYDQVGISLPRTAAEQYAATSRLSRDQLRPGDLVFFANTYMPGISHVGLYIGGGQQINAPDTGQSVSIQPVFDGYWGAHYAGAGRVH